VSRLPKDKPPVAIHHVTFLVSKDVTIKDAAEVVRKAGFEVVGFQDRSYTDWQEFFIHPKEAQGIVVQIAKSFEDTEYLLPKLKPNKPAALISGLHMKVRDKEHPLKLWKDLLGGEIDSESSNSNLLTFQWKRRDVKVIVHVDMTLKSAEEGPICVELSSSQKVNFGDLNFLFKQSEVTNPSAKL
jgi:hypothetical protein